MQYEAKRKKFGKFESNVQFQEWVKKLNKSMNMTYLFINIVSIYFNDFISFVKKLINVTFVKFFRFRSKI